MEKYLLRLDGITFNMENITYSEFFTNGYTLDDSEYYLIFVSDKEFFNPFTGTLEKMYKKRFNSKEEALEYKNQLDILNNDDIVYISTNNTSTNNVYKEYVIPINSNGQSFFELPFVMTGIPLVYINGQKITNGIDFFYTSTNITLTNMYFNISINDKFEIYYN